MNWSVIISGSVSILIGLLIFIETQDFWGQIWSLFFIGIGVAIFLYSKEADKIERVRKVKK
jgi:uncharacterized membrane protein